ncbi:hypothetical protein MUG87_08325 [Ectobacillus sp. JY-23]|uniref:hypothetical protein n=1 Tax=Ectobacillus sp. JY-23 TaxID=2933872 RepID=UPI001FF5DE04|nr:hypothetical protein [Ectobacillus sp. JY-23]UOY94091.1 hypothetical protein MUG87_08325 [Ectobacillus sp. JY-23]
MKTKRVMYGVLIATMTLGACSEENQPEYVQQPYAPIEPAPPVQESTPIEPAPITEPDPILESQEEEGISDSYEACGYYEIEEDFEVCEDESSPYYSYVHHNGLFFTSLAAASMYRTKYGTSGGTAQKGFGTGSPGYGG